MANRDINLAVRVRDQGLGTFKDVAREIERVADGIKEQTTAAAQGKVGIDELRRTLEGLKRASEAIRDQQQAIDAFKRLSDRTGELQRNLDLAQRKLAEYQSKLKEGVALTATQEQNIARLTSRVATQTTALAQNQAAVDTLRNALSKAGIPLEDLNRQTERNTALNIAALQARQALTAAMSAYATNIKQVQEAEREQARRATVVATIEEQIRAYGRLQNAVVTTARARASAQPGAAEAVERAIDPSAATANVARLRDLAEAQRITTQAILDAKKPVGDYNDALLGLNRVLAQTQQLAKQIDAYRQQTAAVAAARAEFVRTREELQRLKNQTADGAAAQAALKARQDAAVESFRRASAVLNDQVTRARVLRESLRGAEVNTAKLGDAQRTLTEIARSTTESIRRLNVAYSQFGGSRAGAISFLGLRPYELQNLAFQVNDLFTQLASGTSVMQAFAQQAGQIVQIQPIMLGIVRFAGPFLALGAAIATVTLGLNRLAQQESSLRNFTARNTLLGGVESTGLTPEQLNEITRRARDAGASFSEARTAILSFIDAGVRPGGLLALTEATIRYARVTGTDIPAATQVFADALRRGLEGVADLDGRVITFTETQRRQIRAAYEAGNAFEAQRLVIDALSQRMDQANRENLGPWAEATLAMTRAWNGFLDALANTGLIQLAADALRILAGGITAVTNASRSLRDSGGPISSPEDLQRAAEQLARLNTEIERLEANRTNTGRESPGLPAMRRMRDELQARINTYNTPPAASPATPTRPDANPRAGAEAQAFERYFENLRIGATLADRNATAEERLAAARRQARLEALRQFPNATPAQLQAVEDLAAAREQARIDEARASAARAAASDARRDLRDLQEDLRNLLSQRNDIIRQTQDDITAGTVTPTEGFIAMQAALAATQERLRALAEEARRFREQNQGRDGLRDSALAALETRANREANAPVGQTAGGLLLRAQLQQTNTALQERRDLVQAINALEQAGLITAWEAEQRRRVAFESTNQSITRQIEELEALAQTLRTTGNLGDAAFQEITARIQLMRAQVVYVSEDTARLRAAIQDSFVKGLGQALDTVAQSVGNLIAGIGSMRDVFRSVGRAVLDFFSMFLRSIAQAIIQTYALAAAQALLRSIGIGASVGVAHSGGIVGSVGRRRDADASWFVGAPTYHKGGIVGLAPNEQAAILQRGEEVLTRDDPRHILNGGTRGAGGESTGSTPIRNVLVLDPNEVANVMAGPSGERVMLNFIRTNAPTVKELLR
jgi:hypothetical protein